MTPKSNKFRLPGPSPLSHFSAIACCIMHWILLVGHWDSFSPWRLERLADCNRLWNVCACVCVFWSFFFLHLHLHWLIWPTLLHCPVIGSVKLDCSHIWKHCFWLSLISFHDTHNELFIIHVHVSFSSEFSPLMACGKKLLSLVAVALSRCKEGELLRNTV